MQRRLQVTLNPDPVGACGPAGWKQSWIRPWLLGYDSPMKSVSIDNLPDLAVFTVPAVLHAVENARAMIVLVPAMGTAAGVYRPFANELTTHGYSVLSSELPGTGASRPRPSWKADYGYRDLVNEYLPGIASHARKYAEGIPVIVIGHSLGAQAATLAVAENILKIDALVTVAAGHIHFRNWKGAGAAKVLFGAGLFSSLTYLFGYLPGQYFGFGGPQARTLIREWAKVIISGSFSHVARYPSGAGSTPSLCIGYEKDDFAPENSVLGLAAILESEVEIMSADWPGNPHSSWIRNPAETARQIDRWLLSKAIVHPREY